MRYTPGKLHCGPGCISDWAGKIVGSGWPAGEAVYLIPCAGSYDTLDYSQCDHANAYKMTADNEGNISTDYWHSLDVIWMWGPRGKAQGDCSLFRTNGPDLTPDTDDDIQAILCDSPTPKPEQSGYDFSATSEFLQGFVDERGLNGATVVVVDRDEGVVYQEDFGEFGPGRISLLANLGELFSSGILMRLHDDGLLDIDAPLSDAVAWGSGMPDVTVAQLLSHSSGMLGGQASNSYGPYLCANSFIGSLQECGEAIVTTPDDDADLVAPDTEFLWPGTGADLQVAGAIAEAVSGKSWAELVDEIYVQPCGLEVLAYNNPWSQFTFNPLTWGYMSEFAGDPSTMAATDNPSILGGAYATADDVAALLLMHLRDGMCGDQQVLSTGSLDLMIEDRIARVYDGANIDPFGTVWGYGMGWTTNRETGQKANAGIWGSGMVIDRDEGFGIVVIAEATWMDGRALGTSDVFADSVRNALLAARG